MRNKRIVGVAGILLALLVWRAVSSRLVPRTSRVRAAAHVADKKAPAPISDRSKDEATQGQRHWPRFDLNKLRQAVLSGSYERVRDINGALDSSDAAVLNSLLFEIPAGIAKKTQEEIKGRLIGLLNGIPGDVSSSYVLDYVQRETEVDNGAWRDAVLILGYRRYAPAAAPLESLAFGGDYQGWSTASTALLLIDSDQYMSRVTRAMLSNPDAATHYLSALAVAALGPAKIDISPAIPAMQQLFRMDYPNARHHRPLIADILEASSDSAKDWLKGELRLALQAPDERITSEEKARYREILARLEKK